MNYQRNSITQKEENNIIITSPAKKKILHLIQVHLILKIIYIHFQKL